MMSHLLVSCMDARPEAQLPAADAPRSAPDPDTTIANVTTASGKSSVSVGRDAINSIFITGDHSRVFVGEFIDIAEYYIEPWQIFERVQLERYSPRPALELAIDEFLCQFDRGYLIFEAVAGVGKTTFLAHEAKTRNAVHHFCELTPGQEGVLA